MQEKLNFTFDEMPFCLEFIGDNLEEKLNLQDEKSKYSNNFNYDCNFFRLHFLGEKGKLVLKEGQLDSNKKYFEADVVYDYSYNDKLISYINSLVNEQILNGKLPAKINVVFPAGKFKDYQSQHIKCPLYCRWKDNSGEFVSSTVLSHLIIDEKHIPDNKYKGFAGLRKVTILNNNETIGANAFADCDCWLCKVELSSNLREIGEGAFYNTGLDVVKLPKSVKKIGKNAFLKTCLGVLALHCDVECIEPQSLLYYSNGRFSDGEYCERKTLIILYNQNNTQQYTLDYPHWSSWNGNPTKVYRRIDSETGERFYTRKTSPWRTYKNAKKYDSLDEESWYNELVDIEKAIKVAKMFETDHKQPKNAEGWTYSKIIFVPEQQLDRAISFIELKKIKDELFACQERMKQVQQWQQETEQKIAKLEPLLPDFDEFNVKEEPGYYLVINKKYDTKRK